MTELIDLLDDVNERSARRFSPSYRPHEIAEDHDCDDCGEAGPDVDLWATNHETGEELWLCLECGC